MTSYALATLLRKGEVQICLASTKYNPDASASAPAELPVTDAGINVTFTPVAGAGQPIAVQALHPTFLVDHYCEAVALLPSAREWTIPIAVDGPEGSGETGFALEFQPAGAINWLLVRE
jgi:hypothetical protein